MNVEVAQALTGDAKVDFVNNRTKRIFDDPVGKRCGAHEQAFLLQTYRRDMGGGNFVILKEVAAPISVNGRHWGGFRLAFNF